MRDSHDGLRERHGLLAQGPRLLALAAWRAGASAARNNRHPAGGVLGSGAVRRDRRAVDMTPYASEQYCYLTTTGRVSKLPRMIEIWFAVHGSTIYMLAGSGDAAGWVRNAAHEPRVSIKIRDRVFPATARRVVDVDEDALARRLLGEKYAPTEEDLAQWLKTALPMAFDV
jgi:deazaflavin-dependent oxidoreductase (nitroreductase family)